MQQSTIYHHKASPARLLISFSAEGDIVPIQIVEKESFKLQAMWKSRPYLLETCSLNCLFKKISNFVSKNRIGLFAKASSCKVTRLPEIIILALEAIFIQTNFEISHAAKEFQIIFTTQSESEIIFQMIPDRKLFTTKLRWTEAFNFNYPSRSSFSTELIDDEKRRGKNSPNGRDVIFPRQSLSTD